MNIRVSLLAVIVLSSCSGGADGPTEVPLPAPVATSVSAVSPTTLAGVAGQPVADRPAVIVRDQRGNPMPGVLVTFAVTAGGGSMTEAAVTTNASGSATVGAWTLGTTAGENTITASATGVPTAVAFAATGGAGPAAKLAVTPASVGAQSRVPVPSLLAQLQDQHGNAAMQAGVAVTASIASGGGTLGGTPTAVTTSSGAATFADLMIAGTAGARTLAFSAASLSGATLTVELSAGLPSAVTINGGNDQSAAVGGAVATAPSVKVTDADANPVSGLVVTFAVTTGGGSITGGTATTNSAGIAALGSWTLGAAPGPNAITATAAGLASAPVVFAAMGLQPSSVSLSAIGPATLLPAGTMTIAGAGFSPAASGNTVTIDGLAGVVTAASAIQLTVTLPNTFACNPLRDVAVVVTVGSESATRQHPLRVATTIQLAAGQSILAFSAAESRCNELPSGGGRYLISVYNASRNYTPTAASFQVRGATTANASSVLAISPRAGSRGALVSLAPGQIPREEGEKLHRRVLEENIAVLSRNRGLLQRPRTPARNSAMAPVAVGDTVPIRIARIREGAFCSNYRSIKARVAYVGTRSVVLEDVDNALSGTIDSTYSSIGQEFDASLFGIIEQNFGNPLAMDAATANSGKVAMVFSRFVNDSIPGIAGFVVSCDFFPQATFPSSNFGQYFYGQAPTVAGTIALSGSPPRWRWTMRSTIIHELKHVASFAERISRNATVFEESWLEESTARLSEELYERARYGFAQRGNVGYGSAANPVGFYCGVRSSCNQARGFVRAFEELTLKFYPRPEIHSPIGRLNADDFSFYATGWSLLRWSIDHSSQSEGEFLRALVQATNLAGLANLEARAGRSFAEMQPEWLMAMALDERPGFTAANTRIDFPSWNTRNVLAGLNQDFPSTYTSPFPFAPVAVPYGDFVASGSAVPATGFFVELSGSQLAPQVLELRSSPGVAAPSQLRLAIVRVQ